MLPPPSPMPPPTEPPGSVPLAPPPGPSRSRRALIMTLRVAALACVGAGLLSGVGLGLWLKELKVFEVDARHIEAVTKARPEDNTIVFDREGKKIGEFFANYHVFVPYGSLPKSLIDAIIAIEDRSFWHHQGFDPRGMARALVARLRGHGIEQGASTLTQQIVRNFLLPKERTMQRKVQEIALAIQVERHLSKEKILELYTNALFLGNGAYGVGAAAQRYFGKKVDALLPHEAALIAGLFQSPSRYNPVRNPKLAKRRQLQVIKAMAKAGMISTAKAKEMRSEPLKYVEYRPINTAVAPYFIDFVHDQAQKLLATEVEDDKAGREASIRSVSGRGLRIYTTLDSKLQRLAEEALSESGALLDHAQERAAMVELKSGEKTEASLEAALLSVDPQTGEVLTMVGGRDYGKSKFNRTSQAKRSPGSAFKPVVYSLALGGSWKWSDVIYVSPVTINSYRPRTPEKDFLTETTLLRAFYRSMNTPTIELGQKLGLKPVLAQASKLGVESPQKEEFGSMLGSSEVTMFDLARMYGAFANAGTRVDPIVINKILDRKGKVIYQAESAEQRATKAVSDGVAYLMTQGMRAVLQMGTGVAAAHLAGVAAGKTGTSNESTDNWFCGYTSNLVAIVWVGTDEHVPIRGDVTGGKLALPIWDRFMTKAIARRPTSSFVVPTGVVQTTVHPQFGHRSPAGIRMYFLKGNEPSDAPSPLESLSHTGSGSYRDVFNH